MAGPQWKEITVTGVNRDGTPYTGTMLEAQYGVTKDTPLGVAWEICTKCRLSFPMNELTKIAGRYYCTKNGCIKDTQPKEIQV